MRADPAILNGVWTVTGRGATRIADGRSVTVLVPGEAVLLLVADLPLARAGQRRAALPFAVEERLAVPLDAVHLVLGPSLGGATYLVAAVAPAVMAGWIVAAAGADLAGARLVPETLILPVPPAGGWNIAVSPLDAAQVIVRTDDGGGFTVPAAGFAAMWQSGGCLPLTVFGAPVPAAVSLAGSAAVHDGGPLDLAAATAALDLRTGAFAAPLPPLPRAVRRVAGAALAGAGLYTALLAVDLGVARHHAAEHRAAAAALLDRLAPGAAPGALAADTPLPGAGRDPLLPLLARAAAALAPLGGVGFTRLGWSTAERRLTVGIEAHDIAGLQRATAALAAAGLAPAAGAVTAGSDRADGEISIGAGA